MKPTVVILAALLLFLAAAQQANILPVIYGGRGDASIFLVPSSDQGKAHVQIKRERHGTSATYNMTVARIVAVADPTDGWFTPIVRFAVQTTDGQQRDLLELGVEGQQAPDGSIAQSWFYVWDFRGAKTPIFLNQDSGFLRLDAPTTAITGDAQIGGITYANGGVIAP